MCLQKKQAGFILPGAVVGILVVMVVLVGMHQYISTASRQSTAFSDVNNCRFSAQTALDKQVTSVYKTFTTYINSNPWNMAPLQWFTVYGPSSIGSGMQVCALIENELINGCHVSVDVVNVMYITGSRTVKPAARVTFSARAETLGKSGITSSRTLQMDVDYSLDRCRVFDYAYFVNNYGWFQGSGVTANGDIRANGNMSLDSASLLNGNATASINTQLGTDGTLTVAGTGVIRNQSLSTYRASSETRSRPTSPTADNGDLWEYGYDGTSSLNSSQSVLEMPYLGDLERYKQIATSVGGTIKQNGATLVNACYSGNGPSSAVTGVASADSGSLVLDGTSSPIIIDGPVVVEGDVIIKGTVEGQGVIYAGRNIHIVGDIIYSDPPTWSKPDASPDKTVTSNLAKDMLGLAAKGNIVMGDYTSTAWQNNVNNYIKPPFVKPYECDTSDSTIGYPAVFAGDYTHWMAGEKMVSVTKNVKVGKKTVSQTTYSTTPSRFYESRVDGALITGLVGGKSITQVDAVLYNNHAIMGVLGQCKINGAVVCRDEAMIFTSSLALNWDIRLAAESQDGMNFFIYLPLSAVTPRVVAWREMTDTN